MEELYKLFSIPIPNMDTDSGAERVVANVTVEQEKVKKVVVYSLQEIKLLVTDDERGKYITTDTRQRKSV